MGQGKEGAAEQARKARSRSGKRADQVVNAGDHAIVIGLILDGEHELGISPLMYFRRAYWDFPSDSCEPNYSALRFRRSRRGSPRSSARAEQWTARRARTMPYLRSPWKLRHAGRAAPGSGRGAPASHRAPARRSVRPWSSVRATRRGTSPYSRFSGVSLTRRAAARAAAGNPSAASGSAASRFTAAAVNSATQRR